MRAAALCVLVAVLLVGGASALIPGEVVLRHNASNPCVQAWALMINRTYPGWEYMLDATGKSLFDLGKYDQCRDLGRDVAQYCYVQYPLIVDSFPVPGALGLCAPAACTDDDLEFTLFEIETDIFGNKSQEYIHDSFVHCLPFEHPPLDTGAKVALAVVGLVVLIALIGTLFDYLTTSTPGTEDTEPLIGSINDGTSGRTVGHPMRETGLGQFLLSFSVLWNIERLHTPHPDKKTAVLNGMRVFSMFWVILGHSFLYGRYDANHPISYQNLQHVFDVQAHTWRFQLIFGAELAVDTFFYLSGFLVAWGALDLLFRSGRINLILYYVHRYWRLTPVYAFCILIFACLQKYMADGPAWFLFEAGCDQWWANLLYITDFYPSFAKLCFGWGWYLSVDFHFYVFTPIVLYAYYFRRWLGWLLCILLLCGCWAINGVVTYKNDLSYYPISHQFNHFANMIYNKPWTRMGPYVIGVMFAFFLQERKQRGRDSGRVPIYILWPLYAVIAMLLFWPVYGTKYLYDSPLNYGGFTKLGNMFYIMFARSGWALGVGLLATLSYWGYGGIARWILERDIWTPMARLTYLAYLVHPMILIPIYGGARTYHVYSEFWLTSKFAGNVSLAYATAFVVWLLVEKPTMNLEKFLLPAHGKRKGGEH